MGGGKRGGGRRLTDRKGGGREMGRKEGETDGGRGGGKQLSLFCVFNVLLLFVYAFLHKTQFVTHTL